VVSLADAEALIPPCRLQTWSRPGPARLYLSIPQTGLSVGRAVPAAGRPPHR